MFELCSNGGEVTVNSWLLEDEDEPKDFLGLYEEDDDWNNDDFYRKSFNDVPTLVVIKKVDSYYTTENICRIYRVVITGDTPKIEAVWINDEGLLEYEEYNATDKNGVLFKCKDGSSPRFNWASCVFCDKNKQKKDNGFIGKLSLYATGQSVLDTNIIEAISFHED
jgi:hypothetical protein